MHNPKQFLREWERCGFTRAHVVDLDAATERGSNASLIGTLLAATTLELQVGGGVRSDDAISALLGTGARYVVVGTRALEDPAWLDRMAHGHPGQMIVAVDVRDGV